MSLPQFKFFTEDQAKEQTAVVRSIVQQELERRQPQERAELKKLLEGLFDQKLRPLQLTVDGHTEILERLLSGQEAIAEAGTGCCRYFR